MITRLFVDSYKCLMDFRISFDRLTLLLGTNGTGKTSVLDVVWGLNQIMRDDTNAPGINQVFPARALNVWSGQHHQSFGIELILDDDTFVYQLRNAYDDNNQQMKITNENLRANGAEVLSRDTKGSTLFRKDGSSFALGLNSDKSALASVSTLDLTTHASRFLGFMRNVIVGGQFPTDLSTLSQSEDLWLQRDARNFVNWYRNIYMEEPLRFSRYKDALKEIIDDFNDIYLTKAGVINRQFEVEFKRDNSSKRLRLDQVSDGQRATLVLYALLHLTAKRNCALFLDEGENYLALAEIQPWLMELSDACDDGAIPQAVLCSHHPELIDYLGPDHGRLLVRENGAIVVRPLPELSEGQLGLKLSETIARGWES